MEQIKNFVEKTSFQFKCPLYSTINLLRLLGPSVVGFSRLWEHEITSGFSQHLKVVLSSAFIWVAQKAKDLKMPIHCLRRHQFRQQYNIKEAGRGGERTLCVMQTQSFPEQFFEKVPSSPSDFQRFSTCNRSPAKPSLYREL